MNILIESHLKQLHSFECLQWIGLKESWHCLGSLQDKVPGKIMRHSTIFQCLSGNSFINKQFDGKFTV